MSKLDLLLVLSIIFYHDIWPQSVEWECLIHKKTWFNMKMWRLQRFLLYRVAFWKKDSKWSKTVFRTFLYVRCIDHWLRKQCLARVCSIRGKSRSRQNIRKFVRNSRGTQDRKNVRRVNSRYFSTPCIQLYKLSWHWSQNLAWLLRTLPVFSSSSWSAALIYYYYYYYSFICRFFQKQMKCLSRESLGREGKG